MTKSSTDLKRRPMRLPGYDYSSPSAYFITICVKDRKSIFGSISHGKTDLTDLGRIADQYWSQIPAHFKDVEVDSYVVMPNHVHGIIQIRENEIGTGYDRRDPPSLGKIIAYYKYETSKIMNLARGYFDKRIWQRNYYDHIIRDNAELNSYRKYIRENPLKWELDEYYSQQGSQEN